MWTIQDVVALMDPPPASGDAMNTIHEGPGLLPPALRLLAPVGARPPTWVGTSARRCVVGPPAGGAPTNLMSPFAGSRRLYRYKHLRDIPHVENPTMRSLTLTGAALLIGTLLTGCGAESGPTAENFSGFSAEAASVSVRLTFTEPIVPSDKRGDCPVRPEGFCGKGEVIPFGQATEMIDFGAGCGGACDLRTINLAEGSLTLEETFTNFACRGTCQPNPAEPVTGTLTDVIIGGTGIFEGATGTLTGTVQGAGKQSQVKLSGTITLAS